MNFQKCAIMSGFCKLCHILKSNEKGLFTKEHIAMHTHFITLAVKFFNSYAYNIAIGGYYYCYTMSQSFKTKVFYLVNNVQQVNYPLLIYVLMANAVVFFSCKRRQISLLELHSCISLTAYELKSSRNYSTNQTRSKSHH